MTKRPMPLIRRAKPHDVPMVIALHYRAFDEQTNQLLLLGRRFMARAFQWYCDAPGAFALVAEHAGVIVGYITASQRSYYSVITANWPHGLWALACRPTLLADPRVWRRIVSLLRRAWSACWRARSGRGKLVGCAGGRHRACLAYLAVDPRVRVAGLAAALVQAALDECQSRGWRDVVTSYHKSNMQARFLYASLGFAESPDLSMDNLATVRCHPGAALPEVESHVS